MQISAAFQFLSVQHESTVFENMALTVIGTKGKEIRKKLTVVQLIIEITSLLWNLITNCCIQKSPSTYTNPSHFNPAHNPALQHYLSIYSSGLLITYLLQYLLFHYKYYGTVI
jgi:hypothetical protein